MVDPRRASGASTAAAKAGPLSIGLTAKDAAGNQAALALKYGYAAAPPKIRLDTPVADAKGVIPPVDDGALISGQATGSEGPAPASVSIDGGAAVSFPTGSFALALSGLSAGKHSFVVEAGESGHALSKVMKDFVVEGQGPSLVDFRIGDGKSAVPWAPGGDFALGASSQLSGSAIAPNGLASVTVSINGATAVQAVLGKAVGGKAAFSVPLPALLPYGRVTLDLVAKDQIGLTASAKLELHKVLAPTAAGTDDAEGLRFADSRIVQADGKTSFLLAPGDSLVGRFNGRAIKSVAIAPATPCLGAVFDDSTVTITAAAEGIVAQATLSVQTVDGDSFAWGPFSAAVDAGPPSVEVTSPVDGDLDQGRGPRGRKGRRSARDRLSAGVGQRGRPDDSFRRPNRRGGPSRR